MLGGASPKCNLAFLQGRHNKYRGGKRKAEEVRGVEVGALVDTGSTFTVLPEDECEAILVVARYGFHH